MGFFFSIIKGFVRPDIGEQGMKIWKGRGNDFMGHPRTLIPNKEPVAQESRPHLPKKGEI